MQDILEEIRDHLSSDTPVPMHLRLEILDKRVEARRELQQKRRMMLYPKDKDMTELDRKTRLDADCAELERDYELLLGIENLLKEVQRLDNLVASPAET